ncbi:PREDICTED: thioredoxin O1, mitochondrial [Camelina sativa]|uniref:Thioredoxin O1, mitochondrial n=1 Tax=Camelina sativa TaxID=90675 RepID=A0ABM0YRV4_CAMSA|nr:PREDICTED: thioredoxin O1, mitochondrial [Camelina sativa]
MKGNWSIVRQVFHRRLSTLRSSTPSSRLSTFSSSVRPLMLAPSSLSSLISRNLLFTASNNGRSIDFKFSNTSLLHRRSLCSEAGGEKCVVMVKSEEEFTSAMSKAQDGSLPSIFYFTAAWCGPCRFISPVIVELSKQYPDVTTYKVDIDEGGISKTISKLDITAVPTLHFFKGGSKKGEIVGADVTKLKNLMEQLYK